tara:strand:- start:218 stop:1729 length:1512 start_codon:yes stop_codon:yes gene_type:complete
MARTTIRTEDIADSEITTSKILDGTIATGDMAVDPTNADNLASGSIPAARLGNVDTAGIESNKNDIAILGFKVAANGSLAKYDLVDQAVDAFEDTSGVDDSLSSGDTRNSSGKYYSAVNADTTYTAKGGGAGGNRSNTEAIQDGSDGGSGGGGGSSGGDGETCSGGTAIQAASTPAGWTGYGNNGGTGRHVSSAYEGGGGGGGANNSGTGSSGASGGGGGSGKAFTTSGSSVTYSGGGGGSGNNGGTSGGSGGGGSSGNAGSANTGGGGGSGGDVNSGNFTPGNGGSGRVWFRFTPSGGSDTQTGFTSDGTWTVPANVTSTEVLLVAGGGPGGRGGSPGGGGGGGILHHSGLSVTAGDVWTIDVGAGGTATGSTSTKGSNGEDTTMSMQLTSAAMTLVSNATTAEAVPTKADLVMTYSNGSGTATIGTDLTAEVSRDNGTTWTSFGLSSSSDEGETGGHTILTKHDLDISSQPSGSSMRWRIKTLNQTTSKETRIHAVSLGWS